MEEAPKRKN
jgi:hypothetical protein